jgi:hypothetical protein
VKWTTTNFAWGLSHCVDCQTGYPQKFEEGSTDLSRNASHGVNITSYLKGAEDSFLRDKVVGAWSCSPLSCVEVRYSWSYATTASRVTMDQIYMYFNMLVAVSRSRTTSALHHQRWDGVSRLLGISLHQKLDRLRVLVPPEAICRNSLTTVNDGSTSTSGMARSEVTLQ